jgi:hypothetical protein
MQPDPSKLLRIAGIDTPLIGVYDAPDPSAFEPLVAPRRGRYDCIYSFYGDWSRGATLRITKDNFGCRGAGRILCGVQTRTPDAQVKFLVDGEGLKASRELMREWLDVNRQYHQRYPDLFVGRLRPEQYDYLRSVTFYVTPDQMSLLATGAQYRSRPGDPRPVLAPFGAGCMQMLTLFEDLEEPQAVVSGTDIAMRQYLPHDLLGFSVTKPMFEQLCALDEKSFLFKPFWKRVLRAREA